MSEVPADGRFATLPAPGYVAVIFTSRFVGDRPRPGPETIDGPVPVDVPVDVPGDVPVDVPGDVPVDVPDGYDETADEMERRAAQQPGYLGIESARDPDGFGITVSYWATDADAAAWKQVAEHLEAQRRGREHFYERYVTRVAAVERHYEWRREGPPPA